MKAPKIDQTQCPRCKGANQCGMASGFDGQETINCWCFSAGEHVAVDSDTLNNDLSCYCSDCLKLIKKAKGGRSESNN